MRNRQLIIVVFVLLAVVVGLVAINQSGLRQDTEVEFSALVKLVEQQQVQTLTIRGTEVLATLTDGRQVTTTGPGSSDYFSEFYAKNGLTPNYEAPANSKWAETAFEFAVLIAIVGMFTMFMRQLAAGNGRAMSFGKARARLNGEQGKKVTFGDVAGADEAKQELEEVIQFLKDPGKFTRLGGRIPKGVLLMGGPGTGKTLLARAVAGEAGVPFFSISGSEFVEMFVGVGASRVRDLFEQAKKNSPCIVFIDEIDAVGRSRSGGGGGGGQDEREQTLNQLLVEMDGFDSAEGVILVAATNRPDVLDPALLRPGRFDRRVVVASPDVRGRTGILEVHARRVPLADDVDLARLARGCVGFSGADLENLVNEAALLAARHNKREVEQLDLESARDKVAMGAERRSLVVSDDQKRHSAYHEAGHAIVARMLPESDPVNKISIVPRARTLGVTQFSPADETSNQTLTKLQSLIVIFMGGRAAEEIVFSTFDTGASDDLKRATRVAQSMVCELGMSEALGPVVLGEREEHSFLGRDLSRRTQDYSEATAQRIDEEVKRLLTDGYARARQILTDNLHVLHKVAQTLIERETLDGVEFERLMGTFKPATDLGPE
ncbi:MAG: ATP-dependent zinc metalloprotease FtsH [Myxococcales bacterium]|nr:ATP-dependent zinc metalloprotease FtsH [Myxococcales bacterium]